MVSYFPINIHLGFNEGLTLLPLYSFVSYVCGCYEQDQKRALDCSIAMHMKYELETEAYKR